MRWSLEVRAGEPGEALAALAGAAVQEDEGGAGGLAGDAVPQAGIVDDDLVIARSEARAGR